MALFGSWFDDLLNGNGGGASMPAPMLNAPSQTPAPTPSPAQPDAFAQLQQLLQEKANPPLWQKALGGLGGALKDFSNPNGPQNNISTFFGGIKSAQEQNLARSALDQTMTGANGDASGQLPSDLPLKLAKLQSMGIDITPIKTYLDTRASMAPKYTRDDSGNIWAELPGQPPKLITMGPGKQVSVKDGEQIGTVNPYGSAAPAMPAPSPGGGDVSSAIFGQESGSGANPQTSVDGAVGPSQILPSTAAQYGLDPSKLADPQYAEVARNTILAKLAQDPKIGNDPARLAVAYFSGANNVAPPGSSTPYLRDAKDGNGKSVSSYVADIQRRMGGGTAAPQQLASNATPQANNGFHLLYSAPKDEVTPIGQAPLALQKAYPGAVALDKDKKPIYPPTSAAESQMFGTPGVTADPNIHGQAYLHTVDPKIATQVKALAEGRMAFPTGFALRSPYWQNMLQAVSQYDPSFDAVNYNARAKTRNDFTSGKSAQNITSFNTAIGHLGTLNSAIDGLNNGNFPTLNRFENYVSQEGGDTRYQVARQKFDTAKQAVTDELTRAFRGSSGNVSDIDKWAATLDAAQSPVALKAAVQQGIALLHSRIDAVGDQYNRGMGTTSDPLKLLSPKAQATIKALEGGSLSAGAPTQVKNSADYNRLPKGAVYLDPNGVQRTKQ